MQKKTEKSEKSLGGGGMVAAGGQSPEGFCRVIQGFFGVIQGSAGHSRRRRVRRTGYAAIPPTPFK